MKHYLLLSLLALAALTASAEEKALNVATPGTLSTLITEDEQATLTALTLTGTLDQRDFAFANAHLTALATLDLRGVEIAAHTATAAGVEVVYPAGEVPADAFDGNTTLQTVTLPATVVSLGTNAFLNCTHLASLDLTGLTSLTTIGEYAVSGTALTSISLAGCTALTTLGKGAFANSQQVTSVSLTGCTALTTIGNRAFLNLCKESSSTTGFALDIDLSTCTALATIEEGAFRGARFITMTLPASLTAIGKDAFYLSKKTTSLTFLGAVPPTADATAFKSSDILKASISVPAGSEGAYKTMLGDAFAGTLHAITAGISSATTDSQSRPTAEYNLAGQRVASGHAPLRIIRYADGRTRKVAER